MSVTEDYCSFEVAKLLKEKGFDERLCNTCYKYNGKFCNNRKSMSGIDTMISYQAPTLQMAMKWLREKHNLNVEVYRTACGFIGCIVAIPSGTDIKFLEDDGDDLPSGQYTTWEKACEAAIKYCLTNLI